MATATKDQATLVAAGPPGAAIDLHPYTRFARFAASLLPSASREELRHKARERSSEKFLKAIRFSRLGVEPYEVEMAAYVGSGLVLLAGVLLGPVLILALELRGAAVLAAILPAVLLSVLALQVLANYPEIRSNALRARSAGEMPEAISYLALSMRLNPSLTQAVGFASENTEEPIASELRNVLWRVYMREHGRIEDAFLEFAYDWGDWNADFKTALYAIRAAELEASPEGMEATLEKASQTTYRGARTVVEDFALSLGGPTMVFFALGVLLPILIGTMLPLMGLVGSSMPPGAVIILFDVVLPGIGIVFAVWLLNKRPGTSPLPRIDTSLTRKEAWETAGAIAVAAAVPAGIGLLALRLEALSFLGYLPFLWALALPLGVWAHMSSRRAKKERDRIRVLEQEYPDALYQLGNRVGEGLPTEVAVAAVARNMKGSEVAKVFQSAVYHVQLTRSSLKKSFLGADGVLTRQPSRVVANGMKFVLEATRKDFRSAGRTIIGISTYLREMIAVERDIRNRLKEVTDTLATTAMVFAPIVLGVTVAINLVIANTLGSVPEVENSVGFGANIGGVGGAPADALSPASFGFVMGVYLVLNLVIVNYFVNGIRTGGDTIEFKHGLGTAVPITLTVYSLAAIGAVVFFG